MHLAFGSRTFSLKAPVEDGFAIGKAARVWGVDDPTCDSTSTKEIIFRASPIGPIWPGNEGTQVRRRLRAATIGVPAFADAPIPRNTRARCAGLAKPAALLPPTTLSCGKPRTARQLCATGLTGQTLPAIYPH